MRYDFSRWSITLVNDFGLDSEYMYNADSIWRKFVHPDDVKACGKAAEGIFAEDGDFEAFYYRARKIDGTYVILSTRGFVLYDSKGKPEYFGGIIVPDKSEG